MYVSAFSDLSVTRSVFQVLGIIIFVKMPPKGEAKAKAKAKAKGEAAPKKRGRGQQYEMVEEGLETEANTQPGNRFVFDLVLVVLFFLLAFTFPLRKNII